MSEVYIPIPHYPPFQLRSSLIDKDPVIWVHLLEGYIDLLKVLLSGEVILSTKSLHQLQLFVKVFLAETVQESTRIFSLGAINPEIRANTATLRAYVFQLIRSYSVVKLALTGESIWNFVLIYVEHNATSVRGLIDGSIKSPMNDNKKSGKLSLIPVLRNHLESILGLEKMPQEFIKYAAMLLGQHIAVSSQQKILLTGASAKYKVLAKDRFKGSGSSALQFAESFVNEEWIEALERLFAGGKSVHAENIRNWMVVSILSLSTAKLAKVVTSLGINSAGSMILAPLLSAVILSDAYKELNPGLETRLPFLASITLSVPPDDSKVQLLVEMFPELTPEKAGTILAMNEGDTEKVTHILLENPLVIDTIPEKKKIQKKTDLQPAKLSDSVKKQANERFSLRAHETVDNISRRNVTGDIKEQTLTAALQLLYESDEDERDDTYDDHEQTSGLAFLEYNRKPKGKAQARVAVLNDNSEGEDDAENEENENFEANEELKMELNLFGYFKSEGESAFDKRSRNLKARNEMKKATQWTDEQIEGWYRMLRKSPKRFRLLEEQYVFHFSNKKMAARAKKSPAPEANKPKPPADRKRSNARNEKNKASKANHNRKTGHNRKSKAELAGLQ